MEAQFGSSSGGRVEMSARWTKGGASAHLREGWLGQLAVIDTIQEGQVLVEVGTFWVLVALVRTF